MQLMLNLHSCASFPRNQSGEKGKVTSYQPPPPPYPHFHHPKNEEAESQDILVKKEELLVKHMIWLNE